MKIKVKIAKIQDGHFMTTKKYRQKMIKHYTCLTARAIACFSFLILTIIGISSLVRALTLDNIRNENGIPASWEVASLGNPETITVPITYWDQRQDDCEDQNRQFEWTICQYWTAGALQGVVKDRLGNDGLPIPSYTDSTTAWAANHDIFTANVTGHDPVQSSDNFYRWFHDTDKSQHYDREITFQRLGNSNSYTYGGQNIFPLDNVDFSQSDNASKPGHSDDKKNHNFHFTAHLSIPVKIAADGTELFEFSGDDDVWVFLNGHLVLDIGGLHEALNGNFRINDDGTVTSYVQNVNDVSDRAKLGKPGAWPEHYINQLNNHNRSTYADQTKTFDIGLKAGDVVNLDFFYAERSTTASNTKITISNMNWPISADSQVDAQIVGKVAETENNLVQFNTSIKNRDPENSLELERLAAFITETTTDQNPNDPNDVKTHTTSGFLPLDVDTLSYTKTPSDQDSWQSLAIAPPSDSANGFALAHPITMAPSGQAGDTLYFRFFAETSDLAGEMTNLTSYYTSLNGASGVTYDYSAVEYKTSIKYHNLKINYLYEDGTVAAEPFSHYYKPGESYEVPSPEISDFTPDLSLVKGVVGEEDIEYTVYYKKIEQPDPTPVTHKVIIKYIYEDGTPAAEAYSEELPEGESYNIKSPEITDYVPDQSEVSGTITDQDIEHTVVYTRIPQPEPTKHTVTIRYVYEDDTPAADSYSVELPEGKEFNVESPKVYDHEPDQPRISGTVVDQDLEFVVTYRRTTTPTPTPPSEPEQPTPTPAPEEPVENPTPSTNRLYPPSDLVNDNLLYLAPLGAVAYVPNTGIISSVVSSIAEPQFAEIILSQGFILGMLAIFASSFAVFFSLRRFLILAPAMAEAKNGVSNKKRINLKNAKQSAMAKKKKTSTRTNQKSASSTKRNTKKK